VSSSGTRGSAFVAGCAVFAVTLVVIYLASILYHAMSPGIAKRVLMRLDNAAIYLFIAGSYTPIAFVNPSSTMTALLLPTVWVIAIAGFALKLLGYITRYSVALWSYLLLGWVAVASAFPILAQTTGPSVTWLIAGGIAYSIGAIFYYFDTRFRFAHAVWHVFVTVGTSCHFITLLVVA